MTRELQTDVVIVGAGIGGAVLALALAPRGWKILLLEREAQPPRIVRPEILWSPTLTALDSLGIGEQLRLKASVRLTGVQVASREKRWKSRRFCGRGPESSASAAAAKGKPSKCGRGWSSGTTVPIR